MGFRSCGGCGEDREAIAQAIRLTGCTSHDARAASTVERGPYKGRQSKFYCDLQNVNFASQHCGEWQIKNRGMVALSSSWGTWQQTMRWYLPQFPKGTWYEHFNEFIGSEELQAAQAMRYFERCWRSSGGILPLAFAKYNGGEGEKNMTPYAVKVHALHGRILTTDWRQAKNGNLLIP